MTHTFTYPDGKRKAVVLSFDDGLIQDRRLLALFNQFGLKGTFHLISGTLDTPADWLVDMTGSPGAYLSKAEIESRFTGHEVSSHTVSHPALTSVDDAEVLRQVSDDLTTLSALSGQAVNSMAYPFGDHDNRVVTLLRTVPGLEAARTVIESNNFSIPDDFLTWHPTVHHLRALPLIDDYLALESDDLTVLLIYGHSWEFDIDDEENNWALIEEISERLSGQEDIWYAGLGELAAYLKAVNKVQESPDGVTNTTSRPVWLKDGDILRKLSP